MEDFSQSINSFKELNWFSIYQAFTTLANVSLGSDLTRKGKRLKNFIPEIGRDCKVLLSLHLGTLMSIRVLVRFE